MQTLIAIKRSLRLMQRKVRDYKNRTRFCAKRKFPELPYKLTLEQPILPSSTMAEKCYNLKYVAKQIGDYIIYPGEILSFWEVVGNPDKLRESRCIRNGKLAIEKGGGLCQAAGIIYHLSLIAGLNIVERYNHSVDLYGDGPRACPIGFDATVLYGYKDLRVSNMTNATLRFSLTVDEGVLRAELYSDKPLMQREIGSQKTETSNNINVKTFYTDTNEFIADNNYRTL
ncbi:MAG: VanW family protein [Bacteroidales bacterium]|nr:VanW family protein [Bacteroidales bacterium]